MRAMEARIQAWTRTRVAARFCTPWPDLHLHTQASSHSGKPSAAPECADGLLKVGPTPHGARLMRDVNDLQRSLCQYM